MEDKIIENKIINISKLLDYKKMKKIYTKILNL